VAFLGPDGRAGILDAASPARSRPWPSPTRSLIVTRWTGSLRSSSPGPLHLRPVPLGRCVIWGQRESRGIGHERLYHLVEQTGGDQVGSGPSGRHGGVTRPELVRQPGRPHPTGDGTAAPGQHGLDEQSRQSRRGTRVECRREGGKPVV
jgi:hypothetical protein